MATAAGILFELAYADENPTRVIASAEGGIAICFSNGERYADIECLNSGEVLGVTSNRRDLPDVWRVDADPHQYAATIGRISNFLLGAETETHDPRIAQR